MPKRIPAASIALGLSAGHGKANPLVKHKYRQYARWPVGRPHTLLGYMRTVADHVAANDEQVFAGPAADQGPVAVWGSIPDTVNEPDLAWASIELQLKRSLYLPLCRRSGWLQIPSKGLHLTFSIEPNGPQYPMAGNNGGIYGPWIPLAVLLQRHPGTCEGFSRVLIYFTFYHKLLELSTQPFSSYEICGSYSDY